MTWADRLLNNHVVISEHRKSYRKTSAQSSQKMGFGKTTFAGPQKHFMLIWCLMIETFVVGLFCSAHVGLELRTV